MCDLVCCDRIIKILLEMTQHGKRQNVQLVQSAFSWERVRKYLFPETELRCLAITLKMDRGPLSKLCLTIISVKFEGIWNAEQHLFSALYKKT